MRKDKTLYRSLNIVGAWLARPEFLRRSRIPALSELCVPVVTALLMLMSLVPFKAMAGYIMHTLPTQSSLPVATVHCIFQDSEGYMWYGTTGGGLCRDNGYQTYVFRSDGHTPGLLLGNNVLCIAEDGDGRIWFGTDNRLYRMDKVDYRPVEVMKGKEMRVTALYLDSKKMIWAGTSDGVYCIRPADGKVLRHIEARNTGSVMQFLEDSRHSLWMVPWNGAPYVYDRMSGKTVHMPWPLKAGAVKMLEDPAQCGFWVATWGGGIVFYDATHGTITPQPAAGLSLDGLRCVDMLTDSAQGLIWVTTLDNLYVYRRDGRTLKVVDTSHFLPQGRKILDGLCEDRQGNIWVAGFTPHTFIVTNSQRSIVRETVAPISAYTGFPLLADRMVADNDGCFWIWQGRKGLLHYNPASAEIKDAGGMRISRGMAKDVGGSGVWASEGRQLKHLAYTKGETNETNVAVLPSDISRIADSGDGTVWIGTQDAVYRYSTSLNTLRRVCSSRSRVVSLAGSPDGTVYFVNASRQLAVCPPNGKPRTYASPHNEDYTALALSPDGTLWCVTQQGSVYSLAAGASKLKYHRQMSNANGDAITDVKTDRAGHVWLLSNQYLREYNPRNDAFRTLRNTDADISVSYFYSLETVGDNTVAADGAGAYLQFESSKMLDQQAAYTVHPCVTSVQVGDTVSLLAPQEREIGVAADVHSLVLNCSTFDHVNARKVSFAYKVEGWNKEWVYLPEGVNAIYLSNLPKGDYRLLLRATDSYGCWSARETEYVLRCLPSWWETWWAYMLYVIIASSVCYALWRLNKRIRLLMVLQQKRKTFALTEVQVRPEELTKGSEHTEEFLRQAREKIEGHIDDAEYGVEQLSSDMCMSRMSLYRKLQAASGLSPNEFIRDIRLKKAAAILRRHPDITVAQLAAKVGFQTPQYFSKCFKKKFGVLPSQYIRDK